MSSHEIGQNRVSDDQLREFVDAVKLVEPFCVTGVIPDICSYKTGLDVRGDDSFITDAVQVEVAIDRSSVDEILIEDPEVDPVTASYSLSVKELLVSAQGRHVVIDKDYAVFASAPQEEGGDETLDPCQSETVYVEDDKGIIQILQGPIAQKIGEAARVADAGEETVFQRLKSEIDQLVSEKLALERATGTQKYSVQRHLAAMAIMHKIHKKLGIQPA